VAPSGATHAEYCGRRSGRDDRPIIERATPACGGRVPAVDAHEAVLVDGVEGVPVATLAGLVDQLRGHQVPGLVDVRHVRGEQPVKRALEVAAAGGHNLLMVGGGHWAVRPGEITLARRATSPAAPQRAPTSLDARSPLGRVHRRPRFRRTCAGSSRWRIAPTIGTVVPLSRGRLAASWQPRSTAAPPHHHRIATGAAAAPG
jgi:hypothetical protein